MEKTIKLLLGGVMLGDTFHCIPLLNRICTDDVKSIVWMCGSYMKPAVEFLANFYPIQIEVRDDPSPPDSIQTRESFRRKYSEAFAAITADAEYFGEYETFDWTCCATGASHDISLRNREILKGELEESLVVHPQTIHSWKNIKPVEEVDWTQFGLTVYTAGAPREILFPNSLDLRGAPFIDVARKITASRLTIGIHSAIACLTFYLEKPLLAVHPWRDHNSPFLFFGDFNPLVTDLVRPEKDKIVEIVKQKLEDPYLKIVGER